MEPSYPPGCPGPVRELRSRLTGHKRKARCVAERVRAILGWTLNRFNLFGSASPFRGAYLQFEYKAIPVPLHPPAQNPPKILENLGLCILILLGII